MSDRVLMIALHFPPARGYSGVQRTLKFTRYLPECGWEPLVLSAHPRVYERTGPEQLGEIPAGVPVARPFALDAVRHLSIRGRYARSTALPDRFSSWLIGAVPTGLSLIRRCRPRALWSTQPVPSAHLIAWMLHRLTGLPWIADFRDSMLTDDFPPDPVVRRAHTWLERAVMRHASRVVVTTPGIRRLQRDRHPQRPEGFWEVIPNGFDDADFQTFDALRAAAHAAAHSAALSGGGPATTGRAGRPATLLHSGRLYPREEERDPRPFLNAVAALINQGRLAPDGLRIIFRAPAMEALLGQFIRERNLERIVQVEPLIPYGEALREMAAADALLLLQGAEFNHHIPAKLFEYLRAGLPLLGLTDPAGDTAAVMREAGSPLIMGMRDEAAIAAHLLTLVEQIRAGEAVGPDPERAARFSRRAQTARLAALLEAVSRNAPVKTQADPGPD